MILRELISFGATAQKEMIVGCLTADQPRRALGAGGWMRLLGDRFGSTSCIVSPRGKPSPAKIPSIGMRLLALQLTSGLRAPVLSRTA